MAYELLSQNRKLNKYVCVCVCVCVCMCYVCVCVCVCVCVYCVCVCVWEGGFFGKKISRAWGDGY